MSPGLLRRLLTLLCAVLLGLGAAQDIVSVPADQPLSVEQERQVERIGMKIHCPICSGESIAQSQTDISRNMMNEVRDMVRQGRSEAEILRTFASSYGDRILLDPPKTGITSLLWTLPILLAAAAAFGWWTYTHRATRAPEQELTADQEARIQALLNAADRSPPPPGPPRKSP